MGGGAGRVWPLSSTVELETKSITKIIALSNVDEITVIFIVGTDALPLLGIFAIF